MIAQIAFCVDNELSSCDSVNVTCYKIYRHQIRTKSKFIIEISVLILYTEYLLKSYILPQYCDEKWGLSMLGKFEWKKFSEVDLSDSFFDFLKIDYPEFVEWFNRKSNEGEEALVFSDRNGVALWKWQEKRVDEIYITIFDTAGIISITESFHDRLFPYSEGMENAKQMEEITANDGITKVYIGAPYATMRYQEKQPVCINRIYEKTTGEKNKAVITSYATITKITSICENYRYIVSLEKGIM